MKKKYQLDTVFRGEEDEFKRILMLREWIRTVVQISDFELAYPGDDHAENILDAALKGQGFHCGHFMIVQNAIMNSYGYVTRCLGAGPGVKGGPDGHHGINEIWSNQFQKWFLSDAKYNHHFEKNGIPLSALEVRDEYLKNRAADILLVKGSERKVITSDGVLNSRGEMMQVTKERFAQTYTWIEWEAVNNRFSYWPDNSDTLSYLNMFADTYFKDNTWIWDGKPHWAYNTKAMILIGDRKAIEWTPNMLNAKVMISGDSVTIKLHSSTPNLKTYQMKTTSAKEWRDVSNSPVLVLTDDKNQFDFRAVNFAGVAGPVHTVVIERK
ncbi:MAG: hypothetical protein C0490_26130 [Marivirga sp.]|nr:hypothetical protein [Marivirga sp.]